MMTRCEKCDLPIEAEDLVEDENLADPLQPLQFHYWCIPGSDQEAP
jgi:hypothetical protein